MKNSKNRVNNPTHSNTELETDVLFQKIYDKWYAFSFVNEECLVTEVTDIEVRKRKYEIFKKNQQAA